MGGEADTPGAVCWHRSAAIIAPLALIITRAVIALAIDTTGSPLSDAVWRRERQLQAEHRALELAPEPTNCWRLGSHEVLTPEQIDSRLQRLRVDLAALRAAYRDGPCSGAGLRDPDCATWYLSRAFNVSTYVGNPVD